MKKLYSLILVCTFLFICSISSYAGIYDDGDNYGAKEIKMMIGSKSMTADGNIVQLDVEPEIKDGRTYLPVSFLIKKWGGSASWNQESQTATLFLNNSYMELQIGNEYAVVDGTKMKINSDGYGVSPYNKPPGRVMLPLRFISEAFGMYVYWLDDSKQIIIRDSAFLLTDWSGVIIGHYKNIADQHVIVAVPDSKIELDLFAPDNGWIYLLSQTEKVLTLRWISEDSLVHIDFKANMINELTQEAINSQQFVSKGEHIGQIPLDSIPNDEGHILEMWPSSEWTKSLGEPHTGALEYMMNLLWNKEDTGAVG